MTEAEWLACSDLTRMLTSLQAMPSERKLRLASIAVCRRLEPSLLERIQDQLAVAERFADGLATENELKEAWQKTANKLAHACVLLPLVVHPRLSDIERVGDGVLEAALCVSDDEERAAHSQLLRDIFGNPFRPVTVDPHWLTTTVVSLARQMYENRDFTTMPILADALQDAGCDNEDVLDHCRSDGPHVRGCYVLDLILGKS